MQKCEICGASYSLLEGWRLACDKELNGQHGPTLLRSIYSPDLIQKREKIRKGLLSDYSFWLPSGCSLPSSIASNTGVPVAYRSEGLGNYLGLRELWISFSGFWLERNANLRSCSFKELEAASIAGRFQQTVSSSAATRRKLVVSSAGNTARAFAQAFSRKSNNDPNQEVVIVIPTSSSSSIWSPEPFSETNVKLITVDNGDYYDAIALANIITKQISSTTQQFIQEGGARNTARRDGMGISLVSAAIEIAEYHRETVITPPDYYFQAIGSGTGAIAAWEAAERLIKINDPNLKSRMKLHLSQNSPFTPMADSWNQKTRTLPSYCLNSSEAEIGRKLASSVCAHVLTNRQPPYSINNGVFDALNSCPDGSKCYSVTNDEAKSAADLFERLEGIDIDPAASVAVASLIQAVNSSSISNPKEDRIVLNITGGGMKQLFKQFPKIHYLQSCCNIPVSELHSQSTISKLRSILL